MTTPRRRLYPGCRMAAVLRIIQALVLCSEMAAIATLATARGASALQARQISSRAMRRSLAARANGERASRNPSGAGPVGVGIARPGSSALRVSSTSAAGAASNPSGRGFGGDDAGRSPSSRPKVVDVPLVFVPGMKGTHLAFDNAAGGDVAKKKRAWLTLGNLLNFPPRPDDDPARDLSLPLSYDHDPPPEGEDGREFAAHDPRQRRGELVPDGIVDHIVELAVGDGRTNFADLNLLPFYGHATRMLRDIDREYHLRRHGIEVDSTKAFQSRDDDEGSEVGGSGAVEGGMVEGILARVGSFAERTSNWAFSNATNTTARQQQSYHATRHCRPTAVFTYDWRRPLPELCEAFHEFCVEKFPDEPVQIVAHSLGGLLSFDAMRKHPEKYAPGAVVAGVPFETGIQYLQDLHKGYFTELDRCRQFTPEKQFTMSSHWGFFPITKDRLEDRFVDVTERCNEGQEINFEADKPGIGKKAKFQPKVDDEWERLDIGIFGPEYDDILDDGQREEYKKHMRIQMKAAKEWRQTVLGEGIDNAEDYYAETFIPPFVACATDAVPTVNQILRRKRKSTSQSTVTRKGRSPVNQYEYDYVSGRSVPGDGRIDFDKAFPPGFVAHKSVILDSAHAKQMCWEESGGSWGRIYEEVVEQAEGYLKLLREKEGVTGPSLEGMPGGKSKRGRKVIERISVRVRKRRRRRKLVKIVASRQKRYTFRRRRG